LVTAVPLDCLAVWKDFPVDWVAAISVGRLGEESVLCRVLAGENQIRNVVEIR
jgi:hypothetical protein